MDKLNWGVRACGIALLWAAMAAALPAQSFTTIYTFRGQNFAYNYMGLTQGSDGNLYGATETGGAFNEGMVYKITPDGAFTTLYNFCSLPNCEDGGFPIGGSLALATDGNFYGSTETGGITNSNCIDGCGTIFKITPDGVLTTLYKFSGVDGRYPMGGIIQASDGNFYGTTTAGGGSQVCADYANYGCGEVFKVTPAGQLTVLYSFCPLGRDCSDGEFPSAGVIQASDGNFYGTTGGNLDVGTVFKLTPGGALTTLHTFCSLTDCTDGLKPMAALLQGSDGNFYGTTYGGITTDLGTVFKITPTGDLTTLVRFCAQYPRTCWDGESPLAPLIQATDGMFYGTTYNGAKKDSGTIFRIPSKEILYRFPHRNVFSGPRAALLQYTEGRFFGTTYGSKGLTDATIFRLNEGLSAFVKTIPASGALGSAVNILGTNLTGASSVTFNGTAATFNVVSASEIATIVPAGATTGAVQVVTPHGTLSSNMPFRVLP